MSNERAKFRIRLDPSEQRPGKFNFRRQGLDTILNGEMHSFFVLPHFVIFVYIAYRLAAKYGYWPDQLEHLVIALGEGVGIGSAVYLGSLRFGSVGKAISQRVKQGSATTQEAEKHKRVIAGFSISIYIIAIAFLWQLFPRVPRASDGFMSPRPGLFHTVLDVYDPTLLERYLG